MAVGNNRIDINQIMPSVWCVASLGCPHNLSQIMTEEDNKGTYSHCHCLNESLEAVQRQATQTRRETVHNAKKTINTMAVQMLQLPVIKEISQL